MERGQNGGGGSKTMPGVMAVTRHRSLAQCQQRKQASRAQRRDARCWQRRPAALEADRGNARKSMPIRPAAYLFFSLPRGITEVTGGIGRSEGLPVLGAEVSFLGFLDIFSLRCSLDINTPDGVSK